MSYSFGLDDVAFLRSRHGEKALETVSGLALTPSSMLSDITEVRSRYAPHDAALIEIVRCRRRAASKLRDPADLLLTDDGVQQRPPRSSPNTARARSRTVSRRRSSTT